MLKNNTNFKIYIYLKQQKAIGRHFVKLNKDFMIRDIAGETILVPTGEVSQNFNGMITLNGVATFILENIEQCSNEDELVQKVLEEFDIDEKTARKDIMEFLEQLLHNGVIIED